jgi:putative inorganic carbon (hco3(-)) transporter
VRDIILVLATLGLLPLCFRYPAVGAICWAWFSLMAPHRLVYGFAYGQQFNFILAAVTLTGWLLSGDRKRWTPDLAPKLILLFILWSTLNTTFAPFQDNAWFHWEQTVRSWALVFLVLCVVNTKVRIHAFIWIIVISLGFYAVKGALFTINSGGGFAVFGPPMTMISDNNALALAIVMTLPLLNYLRMHTKARALQLGLGAAIFLEIVTALGSQSRGAAVALAVVLGMLWTTTRRKLLYGFAGLFLVVGALSLMPSGYFDRLHTMENADTDSSFMGRVIAWRVAVNVAKDYFPFGAGFDGPAHPVIFHTYYPGHPALVAHSIYFEVLGDQGFIGLSIYVLILVLGFWNCVIVMRSTRSNRAVAWAYDLAKMIFIGLVGFSVGGAALSMAYFDGFVMLIAVSSTLRELMDSRVAADSKLNVSAGAKPLAMSAPASRI